MKNFSKRYGFIFKTVCSFCIIISMVLVSIIQSMGINMASNVLGSAKALGYEVEYTIDGGTSWTNSTLEEALAFFSGKATDESLYKIRVLSNINLANKITTDGIKFTLDLNNFTITESSTAYLSITNSSSLVIDDKSVESGGAIKNEGRSTSEIYGISVMDSSLKLKNGSIIAINQNPEDPFGKATAVDGESGGYITVEGGKIEAISDVGSIGVSSAAFNISGGSIDASSKEGNAKGLVFFTNGTSATKADISGGTINATVGEGSAIGATLLGIFNITGGEITATENSTVTSDVCGAFTLQIHPSKTSSNIRGGKFTANSQMNTSYVISDRSAGDSDQNTYVLSGGYFKAKTSLFSSQDGITYEPGYVLSDQPVQEGENKGYYYVYQSLVSDTDATGVRYTTDAGGNWVTSSLVDAITYIKTNGTNANDCQIQLLKNIETTAAFNIDSGTFTLDLNNFTLVNKGTGILEIAGGNLTIDDKSVEGGGKIKSEDVATSIIVSSGNLKLKNGTIEITSINSAATAVKISGNDSSLIIDGGTIDATSTKGAGIVAVEIELGASITMNDGTITVKGAGSIITRAIGSNSGNAITMNGGNINVTSTSEACGISSYKTPITINDGSITTSSPDANSYVIEDIGSNTLNIYGGKFTANSEETNNNYGYVVHSMSSTKPNIFGGYFKGSAYYPFSMSCKFDSGYSLSPVIKEGEYAGYRGVALVEKSEITSSLVEYTSNGGTSWNSSSLKDAIAYMGSYSTDENLYKIRLLDDINVANTIEVVGGKFTLDLNNHMIIESISGSITINNTKLVIDDTSTQLGGAIKNEETFDGTIKAIQMSESDLTLKNGSIIVTNKGNFDNEKYSATAINNESETTDEIGNVSILGGKIKVDTIDDSVATSINRFIMDAGVIECSSKNSMSVLAYSSAEINGGTINSMSTGMAIGLYIPGTLKVTGGTVIAKDTNTAVTRDAMAVAYFSSYPGQENAAVISGGKFEASSEFNDSYLIYDATGGSAKFLLSGGYFKAGTAMFLPDDKGIIYPEGYKLSDQPMAEGENQGFYYVYQSYVSDSDQTGVRYTTDGGTNWVTSSLKDAITYMNQNATNQQDFKIQILDSIKLSSMIEINGGKFTLDLNEKGIIESETCYIKIIGGDVNALGGKISNKGNSGQNIYGVYVSGGNFTLTNGSITSQNSGAGNAYGIYIESGSVIIIDGDVNVSNSGTGNSYGVYVDSSDSSARITGGTIVATHTDPNAESYAVYESNGGKIEITGGKLKGDTGPSNIQNFEDTLGDRYYTTTDENGYTVILQHIFIVYIPDDISTNSSTGSFDMVTDIPKNIDNGSVDVLVEFPADKESLLMTNIEDPNDQIQIRLYKDQEKTNEITKTNNKVYNLTSASESIEKPHRQTIIYDIETPTYGEVSYECYLTFKVVYNLSSAS